MEPIRRIAADVVFFKTACSYCGNCEHYWDRIAGKTYCPQCTESLAQGEVDPIIERTEPRPCAVCGYHGTLRYLTFPLHAILPVEIDLCGEHLRALITRRLRPRAFRELCRQLCTLGLNADNIFLLNGAFYDYAGRALKPAVS